MTERVFSVEIIIDGFNWQVDERTNQMYNPESMRITGYAQASPDSTRNRNMILFHILGGQREVA